MSITEKAQALLPGGTDRAKVLASSGVTSVHEGVLAVRYISTAPDATAAVLDEVERLLLAGETVPADVASPIIEALAADALEKARAEAMDTVIRRHWHTKTIVSDESINIVIDYLRTELERILTDARKQTAELDGFATAREVVAANRPSVSAAWRALGALMQEYTEIRKVHLDVVKLGTDTSMSAFDYKAWPTTALFADSIDTNPFWIKERFDAVTTNPYNNPEVHEYNAWLKKTALSPVYDANLEPEARMAVIAGETKPWLPTPGQWATAVMTARTATQRPTLAKIATLQTARANHYTNAGITHDYQPGAEPQRKGSLAQLGSGERWY